MAGLVLLAPLAGWAAPLDEVPDPVFAGGMIGEGLAIDPVGDTLFAPCDAQVIKVHQARHAVTLRAANGAEILLHIGLDTVALHGEGFEVHVRDGQAVAAGDRLISFDLDLLARRAPSVMTPIVLTNPEAFVITRRRTGCEVRVGEAILELEPAGEPRDAGEATGEGQAQASRRVRVTHDHGLHARPAAMIATEARRRQSLIEVALGERRANARSTVALMSLGVQPGDELILTATGDDAELALAALVKLVGQINAAPTPAPAQASAAVTRASPFSSDMAAIRGVRAAPGFALGPAARLDRMAVRVEETSAGAAEETSRLKAAVGEVRSRLQARAETLRGEPRAVLDAHIAFLEDAELIDLAMRLAAEGVSAGVAWRTAIERIVETLQALGDERLAERAADLRDLERQVLIQLSGETAAAPALPPGAILLADDLLPSDLIGLDGAKLGGLCTARGGPTSHVAVLAAAMGVPAVVAAGPAVLTVPEGRLIVLDGDAGRLNAAPSAAQVEAARAQLAARGARKAAVLARAHEPCRTTDGVRIEVLANVGSPGDARAAAENGAEGCGLLRTEFLFLDRQTPPDEAEQLRQHQAIADALDGPLVVRTLDVGGDKPAPYLALPFEENPALGLRGVRVSLRRPDLLRTQLRAILGVRPAGRCRIMVPMVASLDELLDVRRLLDEVRAELRHDGAVPLGVMIETPAAAVTSELIAAEADFLSIGTNDLAQYALAMDRTNPALAVQVDGLHPAVLRLIRMAAEGGRRLGRPVTVCGGLASDLAAVPILLGLGITELSVAPGVIPEIKALVRDLSLAGCRGLAERACGATSAQAVRALAIEPRHPRPTETGAVP
jgi:phosphoenolpyruvate-protein phosphotransferase